MKTKLLSVASLLFVVLGLGKALLGQIPSPGKKILSKSAYVAEPSQSRSVKFSNGAGNSRKGLRFQPDSLAPPPSPVIFLSATKFASGGAAIYPVVGGHFSGGTLPGVATPIQDCESPTGVCLAVLLNNDHGGLGAPILTPVSFGAKDLIIVADVNNDGTDDVVLVHSNSIDVLISNGDGTFAAPQTFTTGINSPVAAAFWDVNHDKMLDVVVVDGQSNQAAYLLGNGQGGFRSAQITSFPAQVSIGVLADVDGDGNLDLVTNNTLYPGDGKGGFLAGIPFQSSDKQNAGATASNSVAVGDLTGDGMLDVVTANGNWNTVSVFLNHGGRNLLQQGASFWSGNDPIALAITDVNWDGIPDLVVTNAAESDFSVFLGKGNGTFLAPTTEYAIGGSPFTRPVLADFVGDGDVDFVVSDNQSSVVLALGNGDGTFQTAPVTNIVMPPGSNKSGGALSIASADFNGNGLPDFVIGQSSTSPGLGLVVFLTQSNGSLGKGVVYAQNDALSYVAVGDLYQDGKADIVASNWAAGAVEVLRGNGDGTFQPPTSIPLPGITNGLVVADLNGDGWPDVAAVGQNSVVYILLNNGKGSLALAGTYTISGVGSEIVTADFNNDGKPDLAIAMANTSRVAILLGNGNGTFTAAPDYDTTMPGEVYGIATGDLNNDGNIALAVTSPSAGFIAVAFGNGDGTFSSPSIYPAGSFQPGWNTSPGEVAVSDVNKDGYPDIVYANSGDGSVGVLLGSGGGYFFGATEFPAGGGAFALAVTDLNNTGWPDVVTADANFTGVSVLYNTTAPQPAPDFAVTANPLAVDVTSGGSATTAVSLSSINSFIGSVQLACQNLPATLSCAFTPSVLHMVKGAATSSQLKITAANSNVALFSSGRGLMTLAIMPLLGGLFFCRIPRATSKAALLVLVASLVLFSGCQNAVPAHKVPPTTYTITITAVGWNGDSHSAQIKVTVQQQE
jgi:hypothetical protein